MNYSSLAAKISDLSKQTPIKSLCHQCIVLYKALSLSHQVRQFLVLGMVAWGHPSDAFESQFVEGTLLEQVLQRLCPQLFMVEVGERTLDFIFLIYILFCLMTFSSSSNPFKIAITLSASSSVMPVSELVMTRWLCCSGSISYISSMMA